MFGCCKTFFGKYIFSGNANFRKRKIFSCVLLHFKKFSEKDFLVFGKEEGKHKSENTSHNPEKKNHQRRKCFQSDDRTVIAIRDRDRQRDLAKVRSRSTARSRSTVRSRIAIAISDWSWSSRSRTGASPLSLSLSLSHFLEML